jgi:hypothetical protein
MNVRFPQPLRPTDVSIPASDVTRGGREGQASDRPLPGADNVFKLLSDRLTIAQIMKLFDKTVKDFLLRTPADLTKLQRGYLRQRPLDRALINSQLPRPSPVGQGIWHVTFFSRQPDMAGAVKFEHQTAAHHIF